MKNIALILIALSLSLSACASKNAGLQIATASSVDGNYSPSEIQVVHRDWSLQSVEWVARVGDGSTYKCFSDDDLHNPKCRKQ